jgi:hypothetical protein
VTLQHRPRQNPASAVMMEWRGTGFGRRQRLVLPGFVGIGIRSRKKKRICQGNHEKGKKSHGERCIGERAH